MEEALVLLSDGGAPPLAPALQEEIQASLQDLRPQCILDHLKVSLFTFLTAATCFAVCQAEYTLLHPCGTLSTSLLLYMNQH